MSGSRSSLAIIVGIDPAREVELKATQAVESGTFLPVGDDTAVYLATQVARKLRLSVGDGLTLVVQTPQGAVNSLDGVVCGIFKKGAPWFDNTFYISLPAAQSLFDGPGAATNIKVFLKDPSRTREAIRESPRLPDNHHSPRRTISKSNHTRRPDGSLFRSFRRMSRRSPCCRSFSF